MSKVENEHPAKKETPILKDSRPLSETLRGTIDILKLFQGLGHQAVEDMAKSIEWIDLAGGQVLFRKGDAAEAMYVVQDGLLLASSTEEGCAPAMVGQMGPGSLVGEIALLTGGRRSATVTAAKKNAARPSGREGREGHYGPVPGNETRLSRYRAPTAPPIAMAEDSLRVLRGNRQG
jgi:hypothetical protein